MYIGTTFYNLWLREIVDNLFDDYAIPDNIRDICFERGKLTPCKAFLNKREYYKFRKKVAPYFKYIKN